MKKMHPVLCSRAKHHARIHAEQSKIPAFQKMTPKEKFTHVAKRVTMAMKKGC